MGISRKSEQEKLAWLAALIDGEGTIRLGLVKDVGANAFYMEPQISISNHNIEILEIAKVMIEGSRITQSCTELIVNKQDVIKKLLIQLKDLLIVKRKQAILLLEYLAYREVCGVTPHSETDIYYLKELSKLNSRQGPPKHLQEFEEYLKHRNFKSAIDVLNHMEPTVWYDAAKIRQIQGGSDSSAQRCIKRLEENNLIEKMVIHNRLHWRKVLENNSL